MTSGPRNNASITLRMWASRQRTCWRGIWLHILALRKTLVSTQRAFFTMICLIEETWKQSTINHCWPAWRDFCYISIIRRPYLAILIGSKVPCCCLYYTPILTRSLALQPHKTDNETASVIKFIAEQHANFNVVDNKTAWLVCETFHRDLRDEGARLPPIQKEWFLLCECAFSKKTH